eukprot:10317095-Lingulodinium_polyedra.AAC.1
MDPLWFRWNASNCAITAKRRFKLNEPRAENADNVGDRSGAVLLMTPHQPARLAQCLSQVPELLRRG